MLTKREEAMLRRALTLRNISDLRYWWDFGINIWLSEFPDMTRSEYFAVAKALSERS